MLISIVNRRSWKFCLHVHCDFFCLKVITLWTDRDSFFSSFHMKQLKLVLFCHFLFFLLIFRIFQNCLDLMKLRINIIPKTPITRIRHYHFRILLKLFSVSFQKGNRCFHIIDIRTDLGISDIPCYSRRSGYCTPA